MCEEGLIEAALSCDGLETAEVIARIPSAADAFASGAPQHDDMTPAELRVLANATRAN